MKFESLKIYRNINAEKEAFKRACAIECEKNGNSIFKIYKRKLSNGNTHTVGVYSMNYFDEESANRIVRMNSQPLLDKLLNNSKNVYEWL